MRLDRTSRLGWTRRGAIVALATLVGLGVTSPSVDATTKAEVDEACVNSTEAYQEYQQARQEFSAAAEELEAVVAILNTATRKTERVRGSFEARRDEQEQLNEELQDAAVSIYMSAVSGPVESAALDSSPDRALTVLEYLRLGADRSYDSITEIKASVSQLERLGSDLEAAVVELATARDQEAQQADEQEAAMERASHAYGDLSEECRQLQGKYEAEQARIRAEAEERERRASRSADSSGGGTSASNRSVVGGVVCPLTPGRVSFIDSWGYPRSGGRRHKGTDMFARYGDPVFAMESGTVSVRTGGLGGLTIWLTGDSGIAYYYAHLSRYDVSSGQRVTQGQQIAGNGNSGNAEGTSPHVHLQIHPGGRSSSAVNPYPTVAEACF